LPQSSPTFVEEALDAARGTWALVFGRQDAASYFDFSQRGLIGSFIALLLAVAVSVFGPQLLGAGSPTGAAAGVTLLSALIFAVQIGAAYLVLQMMGRLDGFMPYLVADNWANFYVSLFGLLLSVLLGASDIMLLVMGVLAIVIEVNIARRIVTLAPVQVAIFIVAQLAANFIGLMILGGFILQTMGPAA